MKQYFAVSLLLFLSGTSSLAQPGRGPRQSPRRPSTQATTATERPNFFQTESYSVTIESVKRKANNFTVTLVFENLLNEMLTLNWGGQVDEGYAPYLLDEHSKKYLLQEHDSAGVVTRSRYNSMASPFVQLLPQTKLKTHMLFFGDGNGTLFTFVTAELSPKNRPVVIKGLRVTSTEDPMDSVTSGKPPTFVTESYRVVVSDVQRDSDNITVTMIFENLLDKKFEIRWGRGEFSDVWKSKEPYLIDENADRYYLRNRDDGNVVECFGCCTKECGPKEAAELLPLTKLKTHFIFKASGSGTVFTFACKEWAPKSQRPVVIQGLKVQSGLAPIVRPTLSASVENIDEAKARSRAPAESVKETDLDAGFRFYRAGNYSESFEHLIKAMSQGEQVAFTIKHRHGNAGRILSDDPLGLADICVGQLVFTRDALRFHSMSVELEGTHKKFKNHDFEVPLSEIYELRVQQEPWISRDLREGPEESVILHIKVGVKKGNKVDKKDYDFYPSDAFFDATDPTHKVVRCPACQRKTDLLSRLLQNLIANGPGKPKLK